MGPIAILTTVLGAALGMVAANPAAAGALETYRWSERPLLVFSAGADDPAVDRQMTLLADHADGLKDRDMAVLIVGPKRVFASFGRPAPGAEAKALREAYGVQPTEFRAVLLGKDGKVKLAEDEPVAAERLFTLIDGMPMRQREMRER